MDELKLELATVEDMIDELSRRGVGAVLVVDASGDRRATQLRVLATDEFQPRSVGRLLTDSLRQVLRMDV